MLNQISQAALKLLSPLTLEETYVNIVEEAVKLTEADDGTIFVGNKGNLHRMYTNVPEKRRTEPRRNGNTYRAFNTGKAVILTEKTLKRIHPGLLKKGVKSIIVIPVAYHNTSIGVLTLQSKQNKHFTRQRFETLKVFGSIASLAIEKTKLYNEAQSAIRIRDLFISMAAHELRTPTTTIQGYTQLMLKKDNKNEKIPRKWIDILSAETLRLRNLLQELLQIDQIKTGQFKYEWKENSLKEVINRVIANARITSPKHKIVLEDMLNKKSDLLFSDFDKLLQAIMNLVNNAVKFSPIKEKIVIKIEFKNGFYKISIIDKGKGIAKEDIPHVFEGFYRAPGNTKEGMGLGLYLTENIIQRHKGYVEIKSKLNKGTTVEVNLPIK